MAKFWWQLNWIIGDFWIMGYFWIMGDFWIIGDFWFMGDSWIMCDSWIIGDSWFMGDFWIIGYSWIMGDFSIMGEGDRDTNRQTKRHINAMTRPGLRDGPSENGLKCVLFRDFFFTFCQFCMLILTESERSEIGKPPLLPPICKKKIEICSPPLRALVRKKTDSPPPWWLT